jgi:glycosyltransferase involved in cell wall biosynthesis
MPPDVPDPIVVKNRMKILHVVRGLTNSSGTTHIVGPLSEEQARLGHAVSVYFVEKGATPPVLPDPGLVSVRSFPATALKGNPGVSLPFKRCLDETIGCFEVVHIHAIWNFPTYYAMRTAGRAGVPYIVAPQGSLEPWALSSASWRRRLYAEHMERPLLQKSSRLQALSQAESAQFRAYGLDVPTVVIPNAVQADWLRTRHANLAADLGLPPGTRTVLFLSRLHPKKGLDILLIAFAAYAREHAGVALLVAGCDGGSGYERAMRARARSLGLGQRCLFLGEVRGQYKTKLFAGAHAFALISHSEGLPLAVLEAMASGVPVIVSPRCNLPEVASADAGIIVDVNPEAVLTGLRNLFAGAERMRRRGENGRRLVRERFTWDKVAGRTVAIYGEMIQSAKTSLRAA